MLVLSGGTAAFDGADTGLFLFFAAAGFKLLEEEHDLAAGLVFSLCAAKFHLALGIPVLLLARKRWTTPMAGTAGVLVQLSLSYLAEGRDWPADLLRLSAVSDFSPAAAKMPNLLGLTYWIPDGVVLEGMLAAVVLSTVWLIARYADQVTGATAAIVGGLLVSHHAYVYDCILLLPALALAWRMPLPEAARYWVLLLWTPLPYVALMKDRMANAAQLSISVFCLALLVFGWASLRRPVPVEA